MAFFTILKYIMNKVNRHYTEPVYRQNLQVTVVTMREIHVILTASKVWMFCFDSGKLCNFISFFEDYMAYTIHVALAMCGGLCNYNWLHYLHSQSQRPQRVVFK